MKKLDELVISTEKPENKAKRKAITFGSFKRAEERQIAERKEREHMFRPATMPGHGARPYNIGALKRHASASR